MKNIINYNNQMRKSIMDKLFFIDKVEADVYIDFGCADGSMIKMMNDIFPNYYYIGFDINQKMIDIAINSNKTDNVMFYNNWGKLLTDLKKRFNGHKKCLIMSSVLHEIEHKLDFFKSVKFNNFDYLVIRDMFLNFSYKDSFSDKQTNNILNLIPKRIKLHYGRNIKSMSHLIQSMFKSYYKNNLTYELKEDYFSFTSTDMYFLSHKYKMTPIFDEKFLLPYWKETILKDFGIDLSFLTTHIKLIYKI